MDEKNGFGGSYSNLLNKSNRIQNSTAKTSPNAKTVIQNGFILLNDMANVNFIEIIFSIFLSNHIEMTRNLILVNKIFE